MPKIFKAIMPGLLMIAVFSGAISCTMIPGQNAQNAQPNPPANREEGQAPAQEEEEAWQTYRDPQNLFSIQLPSNFTLISETQSGVTSEVTIEVPESCPEDLEVGYCFPQRITIKYLYNQGGLTAAEWFSEAGQYFDVTGEKEIAGYQALVAIPRETEGYATRYVFTAGNLLPNGTPQYIFDIWVSSGVEEALSDQILDTFKML